MILGGLDLSNGAVVANSPITIGAFNFSGGELRGPESITIEGPAVVTGGVFQSGVTRFFGPTTQWQAGSTRIVSNAIETAGVVTRSGAGEISTGGTLLNGGTFRTVGGGQMNGLEVTNNGDWVVDNATFGGMFLTPNAGHGSFNNNGSVNVLGGIFELAVPGTSNGSWSNAPSTLTRFGKVSHTFGSAASFSGARFNSSGARLEFQGNATLPYLQLSGSVGTELNSQASLTVQDVEPPNVGSVTLYGEGEISFLDPFDCGATVHFNGPGSTAFLAGASVNGFGSWIVNRSVSLSGTSSIPNAMQGGAFGEVVNNGSLTMLSNSVNHSTISSANLGTLNIGGVTFTTGPGASFGQSGTMTIQSSGLTLLGRSSHAGTTTTLGIARLRLDSGNHEFLPENNHSQCEVVMQRNSTEPTEVSVLGTTHFKSLDVVSGSKLRVDETLLLDSLSAIALTLAGPGTATTDSLLTSSFMTIEPDAKLIVSSGASAIHQPNISGVLDLQGTGARILSGSFFGSGTIFSRVGSSVNAPGLVTMSPLFVNQGTATIESAGIGTSVLWNKLHNTGTVNLRDINLG